MVKKKLTDIELRIKHHIFPKIDYKSSKTVSYSQFSIWSSCPHRWYLTYIENKAPYQANIHTIFGTAFHETLQKYIETIYKESRVSANKLDLENIFTERLKDNYRKEFESTKSHFSSSDEMKEFFDDGIAILDWIKKKNTVLFTIKNVKLLGIELPLIYKISNGLYYKAFIDFALYDEDLDKIYIYDIKTSKGSWSDKQKKDDIKISQILLYKEYFSKQYGFDVEKINVEFFIVKRKIYEGSEFPIPRVQSFKPASGKNKIKKTMDIFEKFTKDCFDNGGKPYIKQYEKKVGEDSCKYCPFLDKPELCDKKP